MPFKSSRLPSGEMNSLPRVVTNFDCPLMAAEAPGHSRTTVNKSTCLLLYHGICQSLRVRIRTMTAARDSPKPITELSVAGQLNPRLPTLHSQLGNAYLFSGSRERASSLDNLDVLVEWQVRELIHSPAGPFDFNAVDLRRLPHAQDFTWIVRGKIAATAGLQAAVLHASRLPSNNCADCVAVALCPLQL